MPRWSHPAAQSQPLFLGDDIKFLQADPDGGFWIGYGDVGVFSGPHGMEQGGVVRFDATGRPLWSMNADETKRPDCIPWCDHCYALSISRDQRWAYTYTDFLLSRLGEGQGPRVLRPNFAFADTVAADGDRLLLVDGDHGPGRRLSHDRIALFGPPAIGTPRRPNVRWIATVHRGVNPKERLWTARGDTLHCVRGRTWHRLSIDEADVLVPAVPWRS